MSDHKGARAEREAYFLDFAQKARAAAPGLPLMITGGFRTAGGMNAALASGAPDVVGLVRLLAIDPDAPKPLLAGRDSTEHVRPIRTGIAKVDRMGIMEIFWHTGQLKRIARCGDPRPRESGLKAFLKAVLTSGWGAFRPRLSCADPEPRRHYERTGHDRHAFDRADPPCGGGRRAFRLVRRPTAAIAAAWRMMRLSPEPPPGRRTHNASGCWPDRVLRGSA